MGSSPAILLCASVFLAPFLSGQGAAGGSDSSDSFPTGVFVLDNSDPDYKGKDSYHDRLSLLDRAGKVVFCIDDLNGCETIGSNRQIAVDTQRGWVWVLDLVSQRLRKLDLRGVELVSLGGMRASAIALDPKTGNLWVVLSDGSIGNGEAAVFDPSGRRVATHDVRGWDIAYDRTSEAFWLAGKDVTKIDAATGEVRVHRGITTWCASSIDVDPTSGAVWLATLEDPAVAGSVNRLLRLDSDGTLQSTAPLAAEKPVHVSVDPETGCVWVVLAMKCVRLYRPDGKLLLQLDVPALTCEADPATGGVWVVTRDATVLFGPTGEEKVRTPHAASTSQAWTARLEVEPATEPTATVEIGEDGTIHVDGRAVTAGEVRETTTAALGARRGASVLVAAAPDLGFRAVAPVVSAACRSGARDVELTWALPGSAPRDAKGRERSVFTLTESGQVVYDGHDIGFAGVRAVLERAGAADRHVIIRAGDGVSVGLIVQLLHPIHLVGVRRVSIRVPAKLARR